MTRRTGLFAPENGSVPPGGNLGTTLAAKLGVKAAQKLLLVGAPPRWNVPDLPEEVVLLRQDDAETVAEADVVVAFYRAADELFAKAPQCGALLRSTSALWIAWPRRAGGHESDITDQTVRAALLHLGLVDTKVAAFDADWSALKSVWRKEQRPSRP